MKQRYYSLDVFRGATVALMILVNNPGSWSHIFSPFEHASWHGCTPTDLVFPFFLFAVGNAMAFVMPKLQEAGDRVFWAKVIKRSLLIFFIGLFLNWYPFIQWSDHGLVFKHWVNPDHPESGVRILGVLQRIAICYGLASIMVYYLNRKWLYIASALILLLYWMVCAWLGDAQDPYSLAGWFGTAVDKQLLGLPHMYKGEGVPFDPEGLMSTFPAVVQVVIGYLIGSFIRSVNKGVSEQEIQQSRFEKLSILLVIAILAALVGLIWGLGFPINKKIWTSSFVLYTSGLAMMAIGILIFFLEVKRKKNGITHFFDVFGKNPLFIFVMSALIPKTLALFRFADGASSTGEVHYTTPLHWFYTAICARIPGPPEIGSLVYALCFLALLWSICFILDKKKIYIKV